MSGVSRPIRLTVVLTHPVQYMAPWFRHIHASCAEIDMTVLYATEPTPAQQGVGFAREIEWDVPLRDGYVSRVLRPPAARTSVGSDRFWGADAPEVARALVESAPDVVLAMGWHSSTYVRAMRTCRRRGIPLMVRGDTNLLTAPRGVKHSLWIMRTRRLLSWFDACLSVGSRSGAFYRYLGVPDSRVFEVSHAIDASLFASAAALRRSRERTAIRARLGLDADAFVPLFAGKLDAQKRPQDVIRAVAAIQPPAQLLVAGAGPVDSECRALANGLRVRMVSLGFVNQSQMRDIYAAADCLVLPGRETWGLVVNEAMASGLPAIVSDQVGCAPDLVTPDTGAVAPMGQIEPLAAALVAIRTRLTEGHDFSPACQSQSAQYSFARATAGLVRASEAAIRRKTGHVDATPRPTRVLACCGSMVLLGGLERMTFEVLRVLRQQDVAVHCIVNFWSNQAIVAMADAVGASWSTGFYLYRFSRRSRNPLDWMRVALDITLTSAGLLRDTIRFRPTHIFVSDYLTVARNAPSLALLRLCGCRVVVRLGNAPDQGRFFRWLWKFAVTPYVDFFVCNSEFTNRELGKHEVRPDKRIVIPHTPPTRAGTAPAARPRDPGLLLYVGQIIPEKGLDLLLDALGLLVARGYDLRLDVAGEITGWVPPEYEGYRERLQARAAAADLRGRVRFLGFRDDVPALMAHASIHCMPSRERQREAFGIAVIEAKQAGIPTIALPSGALPELIAHGDNGWVCREETAEAFAEGVEYFLAPERLRQAMASARRSAASFSRDRFAERWQSVFANA
jgi:glycosyltransferase involved in cell wall biosynthesis